jgi:hypothetical protein
MAYMTKYMLEKTVLCNSMTTQFRNRHLKTRWPSAHLLTENIKASGSDTTDTKPNIRTSKTIFVHIYKYNWNSTTAALKFKLSTT